MLVYCTLEGFSGSTIKTSSADGDSVDGLKWRINSLMKIETLIKFVTL